ncbi:short-chain dehydrogenase [Pandoraea terrae]|uniref:Short-chain dehydrogenase n=1 Tax=Pandoraea terrae TaxID=1537710 RepID=A0A5E4SGS5_9BURK|nr:SDR family oxidoreductase [Pandoraea terrae]VVD74263.1 short-chain dehydrogenase [Pandoraea terrae]
MTKFESQRVLVIGGSSGIGLAAAQAFAASGAAVTIASRSQAKLDAALSAIGPGARAVKLDTTDADAVQHFFDGHDPWDHVIVSAAQTASGPVRKLPLADAQAALGSKFWGAYHVARAARIRDGGTLTLVSGYLSVRPSAASVLQGAINAAIEALGRGLALELAPVRVNTVSPGLTVTPLWDKMSEDDRATMFANAAARLPARRVVAAADVANAIIYLASTPSATGSTVLLDAGGAIA